MVSKTPTGAKTRMRIGSYTIDDEPENLLSPEEVEREMFQNRISRYDQHKAFQDARIDGINVTITPTELLSNHLLMPNYKFLMPPQEYLKKHRDKHLGFYYHVDEKYKAYKALSLCRHLRLRDVFGTSLEVQDTYGNMKIMYQSLILPEEDSLRMPSQTYNCSLQRSTKSMLLTNKALGYKEPFPLRMNRDNYSLEEGLSKKYFDTGSPEDGTPDECVLDQYSGKKMFIKIMNRIIELSLYTMIEFARDKRIKYKLSEIKKIISSSNYGHDDYVSTYDLFRIRFNKIELAYDFYTSKNNSVYINNLCRNLYPSDALAKTNKNGVTQKVRSESKDISYTKCEFRTVVLHRYETVLRGIHAAKFSRQSESI
ncbi:MAG: hypothetical protein JNL74_21715, partial [Fibrobacteres bacterium]|nr:hypothetical protein [Fibrobacterota bacterium]